MVGNTAEGTINVNYETIIKVLVEVHFKVITRRNAMFVKNQIADQLGILWTDKKRHIINFARVHSILGIERLLQLISKASWFNMKGKKILKARPIKPNSSLWI